MSAAGWHRNWITAAVIAAVIAPLIIFSALLLLGPQQSSLDSGKRQADSRDENSSAPAPRKSASPLANPAAGDVVGEPLAPRGEAVSTALPLEWEGPFFEIMMNADQTMAERNARLISLASGAAAGVPRVQQECLRHLAFGLSNDELGTFVEVTTAQTIPGALRRDFLRQVLAIRPTELAVPLCEALSSSGDPAVASLAADYLSRTNSEGLPPPPAQPGP